MGWKGDNHIEEALIMPHMPDFGTFLGNALPGSQSS